MGRGAFGDHWVSSHTPCVPREEPIRQQPGDRAEVGHKWARGTSERRACSSLLQRVCRRPWSRIRRVVTRTQLRLPAAQEKRTMPERGSTATLAAAARGVRRNENLLRDAGSTCARANARRPGENFQPTAAQAAAAGAAAALVVARLRRRRKDVTGRHDAKVMVVLGAQWGDEGKGKLVDARSAGRESTGNAGGTALAPDVAARSRRRRGAVATTPQG